MKEKLFYHLPLISIILSGISGILTGAVLGIANTYSDTSSPLWIKVLFFIFVIIMIISVLLGTIIKNKSNTKTIELYIELPIAIIGYIIMMIYLNKEASTNTTIWLSVGTALLMGGAMPGICSITGKIRKAPF